jgi:ATP-binding cassette subfamily B (MDR/TAP) protein 1
MSLLMMTCLPLILLILLFMAPTLGFLAKRSSRQTSGSVAAANEVITSMKTVRSMAGEGKELSRFKKSLISVQVTGWLNSAVKGLALGLISFFIWGAVSLAFWYAGVMLDDGRLNVGSMTKTFGLSLLAIVGLVQLMTRLPEIIKGLASTTILLKVIKRKPAIGFKGGKTIPDEEMKGKILFKNITFRYPSRPNVVVLKDFTLEVESGQSVALVGASGSGKSTVVGLLEKWYEPEAGTVELDGYDLHELDPQWLHRHVGIVSQEPTLFATTIRRNIAYAVETINGNIAREAKKNNKRITQEEIKAMQRPLTDEMIENAAKAANAHDFIASLPQGYDTVIGERGVSLSGGQKQRIAIARAMLQDPTMLLLDEATSALDTKSEALVQDALEKLMTGRSTIVIAHRLTTVQDCDKIVVMKRGEIVEMGRHDDLIQNTNGAYYKLAQKQMEFGRGLSSSASLTSMESLSSIGGSTESLEEQEHQIVQQEPTMVEITQEQVLLPPIVEQPVEIAPVQQDVQIAPGAKQPWYRHIHVHNREKHRKHFLKRVKTQKKLERETVEQFTNEEDVVDPHEPKVKSTHNLLPMLNIDWLILFLGLAGAFAQGAAPALIFWFFGSLINAITPTVNADGTVQTFAPGFSVGATVAMFAGWCAIVAGASGIAGFINHFFTNLASERISIKLKIAFFEATINQELGFFDIKKSGKLLSTLGEDVQLAQDGITIKAAIFSLSLGQFVIGIIFAFIANWRMTFIVVAAAIPTIVTVVLTVSNVAAYIDRKITRFSSSSLATANEVIGSIRTVRSMAGEEREQQRFGNDINKIAWLALIKATVLGLGIGWVQFNLWGAVGLSFYYAGYLLSIGLLTPGSIVTVFGGSFIGTLGLVLAIVEVQYFFKAHNSVVEIMRVTERKPQIPLVGGRTLESVKGEIEFNNVRFAYPSRPHITVLDNFTLSIKSGEHVALVGESGSGKSTITGIVERFYDPNEGRVCLDGVDLKDLDPSWLHRNAVGIVTQEPQLFAMSIRDNITYAVDKERGKTEVPMERVIEAAQAANAHDFISQLANGYETIVGERGVSMSGGQKQRIAIARAMLQNTSVLILDEATSALDTEAESLVQEALDRLMVGKTTIVIAHRLSTVKDCDSIIVMKNGKALERGTHDELIQKGGLYFKLAQKQMQFGMSKEEKAHARDVVMTEND